MPGAGSTSTIPSTGELKPPGQSVAGQSVASVAVRPGRQGLGIGRALLEFAETQARDGGRAAIRLYTHSAMASNVALYERLGYVATHREPLDAGHLVHMRKELA